MPPLRWRTGIRPISGGKWGAIVAGEGKDEQVYAGDSDQWKVTYVLSVDVPTLSVSHTLVVRKKGEDGGRVRLVLHTVYGPIGHEGPLHDSEIRLHATTPAPILGDLGIEPTLEIQDGHGHDWVPLFRENGSA